MALTKVSTQFISALGDGSVGQVLTADTNGDFYWKDSTSLEVSGGNISGTVAEAEVSATISASAQPNITSVGTLVELTVAGNVGVGNITGTSASFTTIAGNGQAITTIAGANVTGTVSSANTAATVTTNAQPNITSLGTLTSLTVTGNASIGNILSVKGFTETVTSSANTGTSIAPDAAVSTIYNFTANNNFTFNGFTNAIAGQSMTVVITQDATGSRTLTSTMKFVGGSKTLSTAANAIDMICVVYTGVNYLASLTKGYA